MCQELPDIETLVFDAYAEGFRDGIVEGKRKSMESLAREPPHHVIDQSYEASIAKPLAIQVADYYELHNP